MRVQEVHWPSVARRALLALLFIVLLLALAVASTMALVDAGYLDGAIERWASFRLGRQVRFKSLYTHLLSQEPYVRVEGLRISNPDWLPGGDVAEVGRIVIRLRFWPMLAGRIEVPALMIERPVLHLVRLGPGRNNWTISSHKSGPAFERLRGVARFAVTDGILVFDDRARDLVFHGLFQHGGRPRAQFSVAGVGLLKRGPIRFRAVGGALNASAVGRPYPFSAILLDGQTIVRAKGVSGDAFNLTRYDINVTARGPNLADIGYIFDLVTPNSAPFSLSARASSDGEHVRADALNIFAGASHVEGQLWSTRSGPRREMRGSFYASVLDHSDIDAILAPIPPRVMASTHSGAVKPSPPGPWLLSDTPINARRMRRADMDFNLHVGMLTGYPLPLSDIRMRMDLDHGLLDVPAMAASLYSGRVVANGRLDGRRSVPAMRMRVNLAGAKLADIGHRKTSPIKGRLDLSFDLAGSGNSLHAAAARAGGTMAVRLVGAEIPRSAAWMLGGDMLRAVGAAIGGGTATSAVDCAAASLRGSGGRLNVANLGLTTSIGHAGGSGYVDLATERLLVELKGQPLHHHIFQVAAPVQVAGSWLKPTVRVLPGHDARALGLKGKIGVVLTPLVGLLPLGKEADPPAVCR